MYIILEQISSFHFLIYFLSFCNNFFQISVLFQRLCYFDFTFIIIKWDEPEKVRTRPPDSPHGRRLGLPPHGRVAALGQTRAPRARVKGKNITSVHGLNQKSMNQNTRSWRARIPRFVTQKRFCCYESPTGIDY